MLNDPTQFGHLTRNAAGRVSGVVPAGSGVSPTLSLRCQDIFLRHLAVIRHEQFWTFDFQLSESVIDLLPRDSILMVSNGHGEFLPLINEILAEPIGKSADGGSKLRLLQRDGYVVDKWGSLKLPFSANDAHRLEHAAAMGEAFQCFRDEMGVALFAHYGTLLGYARSKSFLPHDDDVDMSFFINGDEGDAVDAFYKICEIARSVGHNINILNTGHFAFSRRNSDLPLVDIFLSWGRGNSFNTYFGVCGELDYPLSLSEAALEGQAIMVPDQAAEILALTYGASWLRPDPTFQFSPTSEIETKMRLLELAGQQRLERFRGGREL